MNNRYENVADLLNSMDLPKAQKKRQAKYVKARQLSRLLTVTRAQKDAAEKLDWSHGWVSKLETKEDRQISVGDLLDYSDALGMEMSLVFLPIRMINDSQKTISLKAKRELTVIGPSQMEQMIEKKDAELMHT